MLGTSLLGDSSSAPPGFDPGTITAPEPTTVLCDGDEYHCRQRQSADGTWTVAYGRHTATGRSAVFRHHDGEFVDRTAFERPKAAAVSNDGTVALVDERDSTSTGGRFVVLDDSVKVRRSFDGTLTTPSLTNDGTVAAVATRPPEPSVILFDIGDGNEIVSWEPRKRTIDLAGFHSSDRGPLLYVTLSGSEDPYAALALDGTVAWGSDRQRAARPFRERAQRAIDLVRSRYNPHTSGAASRASIPVLVCSMRATRAATSESTGWISSRSS